MFHYYQAPATIEVAKYLINGKRQFYTRQFSQDGPLMICFLAPETYVEKMKARPFLKNIEIKIKA